MPMHATGPVKYAAISGATSGNNTLVAAVTARKIRVLSIYFICAAAVDVRFEDGADGTALSGVMSFPANGGIALAHNETGWFETSLATLLNMELGGAVQVSGGLKYQEVK